MPVPCSEMKSESQTMIEASHSLNEGGRGAQQRNGLPDHAVLNGQSVHHVSALVGHSLIAALTQPQQPDNDEDHSRDDVEL